jgi:hypothetical protein
MSGHEIDDLIQIRATSKRNGLTSIMIGSGVLVVASILLMFLPKHLYLIGIFGVSAAIVTLLIGWFKIREPNYSLELSRSSICYRHRNGSWTVDWDNVLRVDTPKISSGLEQKTLSMVGIKLKDYTPLLANISPRLATNMLLEQRPLLLQSNSCSSGNCYNATLIEDDHYTLPDGSTIKGIPAMLGNRMRKLRESLGYDLFISAAELDREAEDFVELLRQCQSHLLSQPDR